LGRQGKKLAIPGKLKEKQSDKEKKSGVKGHVGFI